MTKNDIFRLLSLLVKGHAFNEDKHKQLQTFCVVRSQSEINGESLGRNVADRFKPYFYSRKWEAMGFSSDSIDYDFPAVFAIELPGTLEGGPDNNRATFCESIQLACVYPNLEHYEENTLAARCAQLSVQEIEQQTVQHLLYLFQNVGKYAAFAVTDKDVSGSWYLQQELDALLAQGDILTYTVNAGKTNAWRKRFMGNNLSVSVDYIDDFTAHKLCGAALAFTNCETICASSDEPAFDAVNCCVQNV